MWLHQSAVSSWMETQSGPVSKQQHWDSRVTKDSEKSGTDWSFTIRPSFLQDTILRMKMAYLQCPAAQHQEKKTHLLANTILSVHFLHATLGTGVMCPALDLCCGRPGTEIQVQALDSILSPGCLEL